MLKSTILSTVAFMFLVVGWTVTPVQAHIGEPCPHKDLSHEHCTNGGVPATGLDPLTDALCTLFILQGHFASMPKVCREAIHFVFVTSETFPASEMFPASGVPRESECNRLAADAGLPGIYKDWFAPATNPDTFPPAADFARSFGAYVLVDGTEIASDWNDLTDGMLSAPINLTEAGDLVSVEVWTNVDTDGTRAESVPNDTCGEWTSDDGALQGIHGSSDATGSDWTNAGFNSCNQAKAMYCFGQ